VQAVPTTLPAPRANAVPRNQAAGGHAVAKPVSLRAREGQGTAPWVLLVVALGAATVAVSGALLIPAALRRRRSRSRFSAEPVLLAAGAWLELLDGLWRAGMEVPDAWTSSEVAEEAGRHFGAGVPAKVAAVAGPADRAVFSPGHPPDWDSAMAAWDSQRDLAREIQRGLDRRQRIRMMLAVGARQGGTRW
jgi:hypothetical protein